MSPHCCPDLLPWGPSCCPQHPVQAFAEPSPGWTGCSRRHHTIDLASPLLDREPLESWDNVSFLLVPQSRKQGLDRVRACWMFVE